MRVKLYMCGGEANRLWSEFSLGLASLKANCPGDIQIVKRAENLTDCDLIGLSAPAFGLKEAVTIAKGLRIPVVLGGHATLWPKVATLPFRHVVVGEGEVVFSRILRGEVPESQKIVLAEPVNDLDTLNFCDRGECGEQVPIMTSRGCPYHCKYCSSQVFWGKPRYQSPERFMEEVCWLLQTYPQMKTLRILDDLFTASLSRFDRIHELWMRAGLSKRLKLRCFVRTSSFTVDLARKMKEMGFFLVRFGIETASDRLLKELGKGVTVKQHQAAIDVAASVGLQASGSVMYGLPGETEEDVRLTQEFIARNASKFKVEGQYRLRPFPGTAYYAGEDVLATDWRIRG